MDADDVLLGDCGDVGHLLLHVAQDRVRDARVPVGDDDDEGGNCGRGEGELPVDDEHDRGDADDRHHVLEEKDEAVAEEEADRLQVDRRAGHELTGLVPVVETEGEAEQLRVQRVPHVVLDAEGLSAGDEAAPHHEERAGEAGDEDRAGDQPERAPGLRKDDILQGTAREQAHDDRGRLGADREHNGYGEPPLVRAQEPEEAEEGASICGDRGHVTQI